MEKYDIGIRNTVLWLQSMGYHTTDSGDGISKPDMECAIGVPHVFMKVPRDALMAEADYLYGLLKFLQLHEKGQVEASYDPANRIGILALMNISDADLDTAKRS